MEMDEFVRFYFLNIVPPAIFFFTIVPVCYFKSPRKHSAFKRATIDERKPTTGVYGYVLIECYIFHTSIEFT